MAGSVGTTYSFKDLAGVLSNPVLASPIQIVGGNIGTGKLVIRMLTQRGEVETAADGTVMPSYIAGASAEITIDMQQTSLLHKELLNLYNLLATASDGGDISEWAATAISLRTVLDGSGHQLGGVIFQKVPDKPYEAKGQNVTWTLLASSCVNQ